MVPAPVLTERPLLSPQTVTHSLPGSIPLPQCGLSQGCWRKPLRSQELILRPGNERTVSEQAFIFPR